MKASLPQNEPKQLEAWQAANLYEQILAAREGKPCLCCMMARRTPLAQFISAPG